MKRVFSDPELEKSYQDLKRYVKENDINVRKLFEKPLKFEDHE